MYGCLFACDYQDYLPQIDSYDRIKDEESRFVARPVVSKMAGSADAPTRHALHIVHSLTVRDPCALWVVNCSALM